MRGIGRSIPWAGGAALCVLLAACGPGTSASSGSGDGRSRAVDRDGRGSGEAFTLVATGDVIPYPSIMRQARRDAQGDGYDFAPMLGGVAPVVSGADLAICHLETPAGEPGGPFTGYPLFRSPPQLAQGLRSTGYDSCSTASNHALDAGQEGVARTLRAMDRAGLAHAGTARSAAERDRPNLLRAAGTNVAHLSYTYGTNGIPLPAGKPWAVDLLEPRKVIADARRARKAGAEVVVVSVHWGTEWQEEPDAQQVEIAERLTRSRSGGRRDIDLIIGTHNHVPQPYEKVNGTWVVYGLGDQVASFIPSMYRGNEGSTARFTFSPPRSPSGSWRVTRAEFLVSHSDTGPPFRVVPADEERLPDVRRRVREAVLSRGAAGDGLTEGH
ncbi:CapA family protein [Streptomyces sp. TR06-5]|uniref:CapA family protein n=1 Tax=unclassified Streptomyces TaxID=2593676 RepID=UPI0039A209B1